MVKDAIGRRWQLGTIQVDYNLPERFELEYTGSDNQKHRPVMIHRASIRLNGTLCSCSYRTYSRKNSRCG